MRALQAQHKLQPYVRPACSIRVTYLPFVVLPEPKSSLSSTAAATPPPQTVRESERLGGSVVAGMLVMLEDEGEEARRMAVAGGQRQATAHNVPAAAMKLILPEVRRKEKGKHRRGRTGAGAAEGRECVQEGGSRQAREGKGWWGRQGPGMWQGTRKGKGEKGADRGVNGRRPNNLLRSSR